MACQSSPGNTHTALTKSFFSLLKVQRGTKDKCVEGGEERNGCGRLTATSELQALAAVGPEPRTQEFPEVKKGLGLPGTGALEPAHGPSALAGSAFPHSSVTFFSVPPLFLLEMGVGLWPLWYLRYATQDPIFAHLWFQR